ncbi:putative inorganic phosphate transporter 1-7-like [Capsicum annuum]|nr:putative inorganic phosphate transporter 1-7-like [Capsicum annuum]
MVDILPECLIQRILCFLSYKEAVKMSILSKTWLQASLTLPNLKFTVDHSNGNMKIVADNIMDRYRKGKIAIEKFELGTTPSRDNYVSSRVLSHIDKWFDIAIQNGVKDLVLTPGSHRLPIFTILAAKSLRELFLEYCNLMPVSLSSGVVNCNSLRKLSLLNVKLDENKLKTLLNSCPVIVSLILRSERFSTLKSRSLKILKLRAFFGIMEIDAPNLVSIEYEGCQIPELKFARESIKPKHSKILLSLDNYVNATWFGKLRKFLSNSISWSQVSIKCNTIKMNDWQPDRRVAAPQVDVLNLNIRSFRDCPALWRLFY